MVKMIGRYALGKTLGTGNFSKVKAGADTVTGEMSAIKIIDKQQLVEQGLKEMVKREIAFMKMLKHPNIVKLKEVTETANHIYLVLELATGGELFDKILEAKRFDEATARKYFHQLVAGLSCCHAQGIAHRDLKPENMLLDATDVLKISDFGLSNLQRGGVNGQGQLLQTVCGTPNYVAPEVLKEGGYNGLIADVWSCGVVLFGMMAGYLPFEDKNMPALFMKIERGDYRMARDFSEPAKDLIRKMLTVDPTKRITLESIMSHPWFVVDWDPSLVPRDTKVVVTDDQVRRAITQAADPKESSVRADVPLPANIAARTAASDQKAGCDAFDLISRLTSGRLNPLMTVQNGVVRSLTRFLMYGGVEEMLQVLGQLNANPKSREGSMDIKGFVTTQNRLLTYVAIIVPTCSPKLSLVELRRGRGDVFEFHELFRRIVARLGEKVRSREATGVAA